MLQVPYSVVFICSSPVFISLTPHFSSSSLTPLSLHSPSLPIFPFFLPCIPTLCRSHYEGGALLRDLEQSEIVVQLLRGVAVLPLDYDYANSKLDTWDSSVLELARVWKRPDGVVKYQGNTVPLGVPHCKDICSFSFLQFFPLLLLSPFYLVSNPLPFSSFTFFFILFIFPLSILFPFSVLPFTCSHLFFISLLLLSSSSPPPPRSSYPSSSSFLFLLLHPPLFLFPSSSSSPSPLLLFLSSSFLFSAIFLLTSEPSYL